MKKIRLGIIGMGNIGKFHAEYVLNGTVANCELAAVCSTSPQKLSGYREKEIRVFGDGNELIRSGAVDAVLIATPHVQHTSLGIAAFEAGVHALIEKPISAHKADAEKLIAAHQRHPECVFAVMYQMRTEPRYQTIRRLIQNGDLGQIVRISWINTDWFRTEAYYGSSAWRATWRGEGGGVLINQCLHNLDVLRWLCGMPERVRGFCKFGKFHDIEVEDDVSAYLEWPNGATGTFVSSTGESPGTNRLEISGSKGRVVLENDRLTLTRNETDMVEFSRTARQGFRRPAASTEELPADKAPHPHATITQNFVNTILNQEPLIAPGAEGIFSLELANAMVCSSLLGQTIQLPLDSALWEEKLNALIAASQGKKRIIAATETDITQSFKSG